MSSGSACRLKMKIKHIFGRMDDPVVLSNFDARNANFDNLYFLAFVFLGAPNSIFFFLIKNMADTYFAQK